MPKYLFAFVSFAAMIAVTILPVLVGDHVVWQYWRIRLVALGIVALIALAVQLILTGKAESENKKQFEEDRRQRQESDMRFEQLADMPRGRTALKPAATEVVPGTLHDKVLQLGHDLFEFLREKGPRPNPKIDQIQPWEEKYEAIVAARGPYVEAIHYGYLHRFRQRAIDLFNELAEHGIHDPEIQQWEIDPPQVASEKTIRKIAERLFLIAARMSIDEASKGT